MRHMSWVVAVVGVLGLGGCASGPELKPAASANTLPDDAAAAKASAQGVTLIADGGAWDGVPSELREVVPVRLTLRNDSGQPLRLRYKELALVGPQGSRFAALPPFRIDGTAYVNTRVTDLDAYGGAGLGGPWEPGFDATGFAVSPTYAETWAGLSPWAGPFEADPFYYDTYTARWPVELPTRSMLERALPEGVLQPGGELTGFVYFQDVPESMDRVTLRMQLVNADTGEPFGEVSIPFIPRDA